MRGLSLCLGHLRNSSGFALSMEVDRESGVEPMEARRQEEFARAWDVVVHSSYVPVRSWITRTADPHGREQRLLGPGGLRGSPACLAAGLPQG